MNEPDFDFPVEAVCGVCGEVTMRRRSDTTDWNSVRHYAWKHAEREHGLNHHFRGIVVAAWRDAKDAIAEGVPEVYVSGDSDTPDFTVRRVA